MLKTTVLYDFEKDCTVTQQELICCTTTNHLAMASEICADYKKKQVAFHAT